MRENIISVADLQNTGHEIIFPANKGQGTGAWIRNIDASKVIYKTTDDYMINLQIDSIGQDKQDDCEHLKHNTSYIVYLLTKTVHNNNDSKLHLLRL